jgi:LSD1 subclass zinc finger protein
MSLQRKYSKNKANGNHVVWTSNEVIPVPFALDGVLYDQAEWGVFRVSGRDMYCTGFRADFRLPSGDSNIRCSIGLYTGDNVLARGGRLYLNGVTMGGNNRMSPPIPMPVNSVWKFKLEIESPYGETQYFPQGITATYHLRYAQGPVHADLVAHTLSAQGVGFDQIGTTFIIE